MNSLLSDILPWLADSLWKTTALLAMGLAALKLRPRRASAASTHFIALCVCFAVPLIFVLSALEVPALPRWQPQPVVSIESAESPLSVELSSALLVSMVPSLPQAVAGATWGDGLVALWALGFLVALGWHGAQLRRLRDLSGAEPDDALAALLEQLRAEAGIKAPVALIIGEAIATPMTWGIRRHRLALPLCARGWDRDRLRSALAHELMHIQRRDWLSFQLARLCLAPVWFHPLAWWLRREVALRQEQAADDGAVLLTDGNDARYARHLTEIAAMRLEPSSLGAALPMARPGSLGLRVRRLIDSTRLRSATRPTLRWTVMALTLLAALPLGLMVSCRCPSSATGEQARKAWFANPNLKLLTKEEVDRGPRTLFAAVDGPATPDIAIEVRFIELPKEELKALRIPSHSVVDARDFSRLLARALASGQAKTTACPRMVTANNREVVIRSVVNTPVPDADNKVVYVSVGTILSILPSYRPAHGFHLQTGLHCSRITGHTEITGHSYPIIAGQTVNQPMDIPAGASAVFAMDSSATESKDKALICVITPSLKSKEAKGLDLRGS